MKKALALSLIAVIAQGSSLLNAEHNGIPFKNLQRVRSSLKQNCFDSLQTGNIRVKKACDFLNNDFQHIIEFHQERRKENRDMSPFERDGEKRPRLLDPYNYDIQDAIATIVPEGNLKKEYEDLCTLAAQINNEEYLADLK